MDDFNSLPHADYASSVMETTIVMDSTIVSVRISIYAYRV